MKIINTKWIVLFICSLSLGIITTQHVHASQRLYRTSIIKVSTYKHHEVRHKKIKLYKNHYARVHHINRIKKYTKKQYHHKTIKHKRMPKIKRINYKRKKVLNRFKTYNFKYHYDIITAEPVREYSNIKDVSNRIIPKGQILRVKSAIYQHHKITPFGFKLTNGDYIPSYAVAYIY